MSWYNWADIGSQIYGCWHVCWPTNWWEWQLLRRLCSRAGRYGLKIESPIFSHQTRCTILIIFFFLLKNKLQITKTLLKALLLFYCYDLQQICPAIVNSAASNSLEKINESASFWKDCPFLMKCFCKHKFNMSDCLLL